MDQANICSPFVEIFENYLNEKAFNNTDKDLKKFQNKLLQNF